jgi:hypothetical protein
MGDRSPKDKVKQQKAKEVEKAKMAQAMQKAKDEKAG